MAALADNNLTLCVPRPSSGKNPNEPTLVVTPKPRADDLPPNHILLRVDRFGFSANNTTYQALGEAPHFRYFEFHAPPSTDHVSPKTHGLIPVWGFATVLASTHPSVTPGERVYGYLAPARYLVVPVSPTDVNKRAFYVPRPHLPADRRPYNQLIRCAADTQYIPTGSGEDLAMLYRPLFWTAFWCADWLAAARFRGATRMLVSSASAKTAFCLAYCARQQAAAGAAPQGLRIVGLTSRRNETFTRGLGLYDDVVTYDDLERADAVRPQDGDRWLYVDVAGSAELNERVFSHFAPRCALAAGVTLGMTTLNPADADGSSPRRKLNTALAAAAAVAPTGVEPAAAAQALGKDGMEDFFMVEWLDVRRREWSVAQIAAMQDAAWAALMRDCPPWVRIERMWGGDGVRRAYEQIVGGKVGPERGYVWSLWDSEEVGRAKL